MYTYPAPFDGIVTYGPTQGIERTVCITNEEGESVVYLIPIYKTKFRTEGSSVKLGESLLDLTKEAT